MSHQFQYTMPTQLKINSFVSGGGALTAIIPLCVLYPLGRDPGPYFWVGWQGVNFWTHPMKLCISPTISLPNPLTHLCNSCTSRDTEFTPGNDFQR